MFEMLFNEPNGRQLVSVCGQVCKVSPGVRCSPRHRYACQTKLLLAWGGVKLS